MERVEKKVLDHGFVALIDVMGNDDAVVQAARVSYGKGTKKRSEDKALIRYMMRHRHTSVFEMVSFKFHIKAPIVVFRQWHRHRTSKINELSGRYSELPEECYVPEISRLQKQSVNNKQGSGDKLDCGVQKNIQELMIRDQANSFNSYRYNLENGLSRELARLNLPLSTYSEMYWKMDLHNLFHFLKLRMDEHAQYEIRAFATTIFELIKPIVPVSCEAFEDYVLGAVTFSKKEMELVRNFPLTEQGLKGLSKREKAEFLKKVGWEI